MKIALILLVAISFQLSAQGDNEGLCYKVSDFAVTAMTRRQEGIFLGDITDEDLNYSTVYKPMIDEYPEVHRYYVSKKFSKTLKGAYKKQIGKNKDEKELYISEYRNEVFLNCSNELDRITESLLNDEWDNLSKVDR